MCRDEYIFSFVLGNYAQQPNVFENRCIHEETDL